MAYLYVAMDPCVLPPLVQDDLVIDAGSTFTCAHGLVYGIRHVAFNGWTVQPAWVRQVDPPRVVQQTTVSTPSMAKGTTTTVVVTWDKPMPSAVYSVSLAKATSQSVVQWQVASQTTTDATITVTALVALNAAQVTVLAST